MLTSQSIRDVCASHASTHPDDFFYLLADHAGMPGLQRKLTDTKVGWVSLFEGTTQTNALSVAPLLIRIGRGSQSLCGDVFLTWICERGAYSSSLLIVASQLTIRELAGRLTARLDAKISDDMDVLLRFFDPRVFEQLARCLTDEQRNVFFSPASSWWYVDRRGELQAVQAQFSNDENFVSPLILSARQEHELVDASEPDQVEEQLRLWLPNEFARLSPPDRHNFIARHMTAGRNLRITLTRELALYCALALVYGEDFASDAEWSSALDLIRQGKHDLTSVVSSLNESQHA
jgi:hypothetical protein